MQRRPYKLLVRTPGMDGPPPYLDGVQMLTIEPGHEDGKVYLSIGDDSIGKGGQRFAVHTQELIDILTLVSLTDKYHRY